MKSAFFAALLATFCVGQIAQAADIVNKLECKGTGVTVTVAVGSDEIVEWTVLNAASDSLERYMGFNNAESANDVSSTTLGSDIEIVNLVGELINREGNEVALRCQFAD